MSRPPRLDLDERAAPKSAKLAFQNTCLCIGRSGNKERLFLFVIQYDSKPTGGSFLRVYIKLFKMSSFDRNASLTVTLVS